MRFDKIKFGCPKAPNDSRDRLYTSKLDGSSFQNIDLRANCPPVRDQLNLGACTAFGTTALFNFVRMKHGLPKWLPSPLFTYYDTRAMSGEQNQDSGAYVRDALKSTVKSGVAMERIWPYFTTRFDEKPSSDAYTNAEKHQTIEYLSIVNYDKNKFLSCLAEGYPFVFGIAVYPSFMNSKGGIVPMPDKSKEASLGGHCMLCVGYRKNDDGSEVLIAQNSWNTYWGDAGYCYIPMNYFLNEAYDLWTIRNTEASADDTSDEDPDPKPVPVPPIPAPVPPAPAPEPAPVKDNGLSKTAIAAIIIFILLAVLFTIL